MRKHVYKMTPREIEIWRLIGMGLTDKEIARDLRISVNTVKTHTKRIYEKVGLNIRVKVALAYLRSCPDPNAALAGLD